MKSAIIIFPGTNRDSDMVMALEKVSGKTPQQVWYIETDLPVSDLYTLYFSIESFICFSICPSSISCCPCVNHVRESRNSFSGLSFIVVLISRALLVSSCKFFISLLCFCVSNFCFVGGQFSVIFLHFLQKYRCVPKIGFSADICLTFSYCIFLLYFLVILMYFVIVL